MNIVLLLETSATAYALNSILTDNRVGEALYELVNIFIEIEKDCAKKGLKRIVDPICFDRKN